jgi:hypothetical protein
MSDWRFRDYDHSIDDLEFEAIFIGETEIGINIKIEGEDIWVGKSIAKINQEKSLPGDKVTIILPEWCAKQHGLV